LARRIGLSHVLTITALRGRTIARKTVKFHQVVRAELVTGKAKCACNLAGPEWFGCISPQVCCLTSRSGKSSIAPTRPLSARNAALGDPDDER